MASGIGNQLHSPLVALASPSTRRHSGHHAKAKVNWRRSERVLELVSTCVQGAFRVSPWENLSDTDNDHVVEKVIPVAEQRQVLSQQQRPTYDHQESNHSGKRVHEAPSQKTTLPSTSSNLPHESFSGLSSAKSGDPEDEDLSESCATISQLLDEAEDEAPDISMETQDDAGEEQSFLTQAMPPHISLQQSPAPKPQLPLTLTVSIKPHLDTLQRKSIIPSETESLSTSESPMKSTDLIPVVSTPPLKLNNSLPLNLSTEERHSLQVGDQELSAVQQPPQAHHLYSQSITDTDSAPSMVDQKMGPSQLETKSADSSLSPSVTSPTKKRPYQKTSIWNLSPADFGYTGNESDPGARSKKKGKVTSTTIQSSRSGSGSGAGSASSLASLAGATSPKPKTRSAPRRQVSFTSSVSSSLLEGNMEDIEGYVGEDLDGFENRLSY